MVNAMRKYASLLLALCLLLTACSAGAESGGEPLRVVATDFPCYDLARQVLGSEATVTGWLLPEDAAFGEISGLRIEARQKLERMRPRSLSQAGRIPGVNPADIAVLMVWLKKRHDEARGGAAKHPTSQILSLPRLRIVLGTKG